MHVGFGAWVVCKFISTGLYKSFFSSFLSFNLIMTATISSRKSVQKQKRKRTKRRVCTVHSISVIWGTRKVFPSHQGKSVLRVNFKGRLFWKEEREKGGKHKHTHSLRCKHAGTLATVCSCRESDPYHPLTPEGTGECLLVCVCVLGETGEDDEEVAGWWWNIKS